MFNQRLWHRQCIARCLVVSRIPTAIVVSTVSIIPIAMVGVTVSRIPIAMVVIRVSRIPTAIVGVIQFQEFT